MRRRTLLSLTICAGLLWPLSPANGGSHRAPAANQSARPVDVALTPEGTLRGVVLDSGGAPQPGVLVVLSSSDAVRQQSVTQSEGAYAFPHLKTGVYELATGGNLQQVRLWSAENAPPGATVSLPLRAKSPVVRGQWGGPGPGAIADMVILGVGAAGLGFGLAAWDKAQDLEDQLDTPVSP